jgi:release factor glutamine methyltransferase
MLALLAHTQTVAMPYDTNVLGIELMVLPQVFSPLFYGETEFFARTLPSQKGKSFLEIGPGTGVISIVAARQGATSVVCVDINPHAIRNTERNIAHHGLSTAVDVRVGNLYDPIQPQERWAHAL